ncbi:MAG TPA: PDZ domain-containing protein [Polyangiaceae bacterium]
MQRRLPQLTCFLLACSGAATTNQGSIGAVLGQARGDGRVIVREAPPGYPAANAGVASGDEILLIDGRDVRSMSPEAIHRALQGPLGSTVRLTILRRGKIERLAVARAPLAEARRP